MGKAAVHQPALAVLSHKPVGASKNIAWCGKGIVYDTGGLCIKGKVKIVSIISSRFSGVLRFNQISKFSQRVYSS